MITHHTKAAYFLIYFQFLTLLSDIHAIAVANLFWRVSKAAVASGQWLLYRYHPERASRGKNPLQLDSSAPKLALEKYMYMENCFKMLTTSKPEDAKRFLQEAKQEVSTRWSMYEHMAARGVEKRG